ncbi:DNA repair protein RecO [Croceivirga thetidis]|uniref:DNA repair protein RecO n=1 Tax=Croceivirga thetidis TaxID=2721623 RepID=A0ABX1GPD9_9FLAO|nr:DNA repair protein RecO [Croceivirga thetidis]NKI31444.1 DNA repair protein RecO [Croceivirga thetidis]
MQVTTRAIVLSSLKYGDSSLIVKAFTASDGLKSYLLKGVLTSKKSKLKAALFQPLTQLELVAYHKNKGSLESIREAKVVNPYKTLHSDIIKNSLVLFLAEMLTNSIQEEQADQSLLNYLEYSFSWLDNNDFISQFHLLFLVNLSKYLGFYPDESNISGHYFDLLEGNFRATPNLNPLIENEQTELFKRFLGINFDALKSIKTNKRSRQELLKSVILYYELHLHGFRKPKSLAVLNAVFD